jgi:hypothetical protein
MAAGWEQRGISSLWFPLVGVAQLMLHICAMYRDRTIAWADGGRAGKHRQCIKSGASPVEEDELTALRLEDGREG